MRGCRGSQCHCCCFHCDYLMHCCQHASHCLCHAAAVPLLLLRTTAAVRPLRRGHQMLCRTIWIGLGRMQCTAWKHVISLSMPNIQVLPLPHTSLQAPSLCSAGPPPPPHPGCTHFSCSLLPALYSLPSRPPQLGVPGAEPRATTSTLCRAKHACGQHTETSRGMFSAVAQVKSASDMYGR
jgi:hypothetical protein